MGMREVASEFPECKAVQYMDLFRVEGRGVDPVKNFVGGQPNCGGCTTVPNGVVLPTVALSGLYNYFKM